MIGHNAADKSNLLDALCARLHGLTREETDYILETFPIVKRKDEER